MKKQIIFYSVIGAAAIIFAAGFLLSQYVKYKQFRLSQEKVIEDCIEKGSGLRFGFDAANKAQKCRDRFSQ